MDWTSWSRTWSTTKSTTTTSRIPLRRSRTNSRWKRMYLHSQADQRLKQNHEDLLLLAHLQELYLSVTDFGLILSQELVRISLYQCERRMTTLLRHGFLLREENGAIEFWRLNDDLRNEFENSKSDEMWKSKMAGGGGIKKRFQYCMDSSGHEILYLRAPQGHSGPAIPLILNWRTMYWFPTISSSTLIISDVQSVHTPSQNSALIAGGQNFKQGKTDGILYSRESHAYGSQGTRESLIWPNHVLDGTSRKTWKRNQDTVYWIDIQLTQRKGLNFYQTRCNTVVLYDTLPAYCISKAVVMKSVEIIYQKVFASPRPPPKISFKDNWMKELGSEVAGGGTPNKPNQKTENKWSRTDKNPPTQTKT